jgi:putative Holliday junction resolvase
MGAAGTESSSRLSAARVLAVDWGDKRIGLALSDELGLLATPVGTITRRAGKRPPISELLRRADAAGATAMIFGLPLAPNGEDTDRSLEVRAVAARVAARQSRPVRLVDERFTTAQALRQVRAQGGSTRGRKDDVDALAAAVLLDGLLRARAQGVELGEAVVATPVAHEEHP